MHKNGKYECDGRCIYGVESRRHGNSLDMGNGEEGRVRVDFDALKLNGFKGLL